MELFWFLLGLTVGLLLLGGYYLRLNLRLKKLVRELEPEALGWSMSSTAKLTRAIASHGKAQRVLEQQLATWKQIFQIAPIGFLQVDEENQLVWCNAKACQLLDIQHPQQPRPRLLLELVRSYELDDLIEQTRTDCQPSEREWIFNPVFADQSKLSQQQPRPLRAYGFPLLDGSIGVFLESRQEAVLLAQQRDRWTSDVAHELKTPLTSIRLVAETLLPRLDSPMRNWVERMLQETIRLSNLVQDLLDLSHLQASPTPHLNLKSVDLPKLIQSAWLSLEPLARKKSLQLHYRGPESLLTQADEPRLHRVLLNLLDNSIKFSPIEESIYVCLTLRSVPDPQPCQQIHLEVIDTGPGFSLSDLPYVFERFYRADTSRSRNSYRLEVPENDSSRPASSERSRSLEAKFSRTEVTLPTSSGSGLGLAIVRQIVEAHHGLVEASNHPETRGAWLQVFLPWQPAE